MLTALKGPALPARMGPERSGKRFSSAHIAVVTIRARAHSRTRRHCYQRRREPVPGGPASRLPYGGGSGMNGAGSCIGGTTVGGPSSTGAPHTSGPGNRCGGADPLRSRFKPPDLDSGPGPDGLRGDRGSYSTLGFLPSSSALKAVKMCMLEPGVSSSRCRPDPRPQKQARQARAHARQLARPRARGARALRAQGRARAQAETRRTRARAARSIEVAFRPWRLPPPTNLRRSHA